jgi:hypothetical protein
MIHVQFFVAIQIAWQLSLGSLITSSSIFPEAIDESKAWWIHPNRPSVGLWGWTLSYIAHVMLLGPR